MLTRLAFISRRNEAIFSLKIFYTINTRKHDLPPDD